MSRFSQCVRFILERIARSVAICTAIYFAVYTAIVVLIYTIGISGHNTNTNANYIICALIFIFILFSSYYKGLYNHLLLFGNTRRSILGALFLSGVLCATAMAVLSVLSDALNLLLSRILGFRTFMLLQIFYPDAGVAAQLLWYFALLLLVFCFGMLYGALAYRFGKKFRIVFWAAFGLLWVGAPLLSLVSFRHALYRIFRAYFALDGGFGLVRASLNLVLSAAVLGVIAWLLGRRQPQVAD